MADDLPLSSTESAPDTSENWVRRAILDLYGPAVLGAMPPELVTDLTNGLKEEDDARPASNQ